MTSTNTKTNTISVMANWLFINIHCLYKILYFIYKRIADREYISWIKRYLKKGMVVVDIGSNIGFYSILFSRCVGKEGKVFSFEPDKVNFRFLKKNTARRKNIRLNNLAVGNTNSLINLYLSKSSNTNHRTYYTGKKGEIKKIRCVTLDKFFQTKQKIDLIKVDIEGFDYFAIMGAQNLIKRQDKIAVMAELWPSALKENGIKVQNYFDLLKKLNFKTSFVNGKRPNINKLPNNYYTNIIAISGSKHKRSF